MEVDRLRLGEELNEGAVTAPRPAASVIVLRNDTQALEVLLVQRNPAQRFMGGAWVFPGGALDPEDGEGQPGLRAAGLRECAEEAGVALTGLDALEPWSRWITPAQVKIRFDTWFYLAPAPADASPRVDGYECVDWRWSSPGATLAAHAADELSLVFPTVRHLEQLSAFESAEELLAFARGRTVEPIEPRVRMEGETARVVVLPGEPGYEEAARG